MGSDGRKIEKLLRDRRRAAYCHGIFTDGADVRMLRFWDFLEEVVNL